MCKDLLVESAILGSFVFMFFYFMKVKNASQISRKIFAVYGQSAVSEDTVRKCFEIFNFNLKYYDCSGWLPSVREDHLKEALHVIYFRSYYIYQLF